MTGGKHMANILQQLSIELHVKKEYIERTVALIDDGNTIPFIARYRKEVTGELDDAVLRDLYERLNYLRNLEARKTEVTRLIQEQNKLTEELSNRIQSAITVQEIDDLYLPYRPKRRTRATIAREKGLQPLAELYFQQKLLTGSIEMVAQPYINPEMGVDTTADAINGAIDIIAEWMADDADIRKAVREYTFQNGIVVSKGDADVKSVFEMYYDYQEPVKKIVPHRILALNRGESEKILNIKILVEGEAVIHLVQGRVLHLPVSISHGLVLTALQDGYKRLIQPSIEREIRNILTETAEEQAIKIFGVNLKNLLLQPPVKGKTVLGLDPGYRTGCKIAVVDETGKVLDATVVYITLPHHPIDQGKKILKELIEKYQIELVSIGNGTASKESEMVVVDLLKTIHRTVYYMIVNEAGASVYSASKLGSEEFPEYDVSLRSAVSIARRLQDPLAELVKIDPKSIGVGQYQHDVNQKHLAESLEGAVEFCVNGVGVDLNTASSSLLQHVSGINSSIAKNIVSFREENGKFKARKQLRKVKKLGEKAFQQCAGFLRIAQGDNILDNTAVHPESYDAVIKLLEIKKLSLKDIQKNGLIKLRDEVVRWNLPELANQLEIGVPTLQDIIAELLRPGRDPRDELPKPILRTDVLDLKDVKPDMVFTGTVRNVIDFGVFVDIGVHQDGLVHISQLSDKFVKHPTDVVQVGDIVQVKVLEVNTERKRISLTMREL